MIELVIQGTTYEIPSSGEDPNWSEGLLAWIQAINETVNLLLGPDDILPRSANLLNNQASPVLIRGFFFNPATVRAANIQYTSFRKTDSSTLVENGEILLNYSADAPVGQKWKISQDRNGNSGILFTITDDGQFYYTSSDLTGANYTGTLRFQAKALTQI